MKELDSIKFCELIFDYTKSSSWNFQNNTPVVLDFYSNGCGTCIMIKPLLEELEVKYPDINFYKIDADSNKELSDLFSIQKVPSILFIVKDKNIKSIGVASISEYEKIIQTHLLS